MIRTIAGQIRSRGMPTTYGSKPISDWGPVLPMGLQFGWDAQPSQQMNQGIFQQPAQGMNQMPQQGMYQMPQQNMGQPTTPGNQQSPFSGGLFGMAQRNPQQAFQNSQPFGQNQQQPSWQTGLGGFGNLWGGFSGRR